LLKAENLRWCGPCRKLAPILEEKAKNADGKWILAKFDIDEIPQLASALQVIFPLLS
jgi:Thioredoxin domain-containing protein